MVLFSKYILRCIYNGTIIQSSKNMGGLLWGKMNIKITITIILLK